MIFLMGTHREEDIIRSVFDTLLFDLIISEQNSNLRWIATTEGVDILEWGCIRTMMAKEVPVT